MAALTTCAAQAPAVVAWVTQFIVAATRKGAFPSESEMALYPPPRQHQAWQQSKRQDQATRKTRRRMRKPPPVVPPAPGNIGKPVIDIDRDLTAPATPKRPYRRTC